MNFYAFTFFSALILGAMPLHAGTATVSDAGIKTLGSSAAYVATCEKEGLMPKGTIADLIVGMQQALTIEHWQKVKTQYQASLHEKRQYTVAKDRWIPFRLDSTNCGDLAKALPVVLASLIKNSR